MLCEYTYIKCERRTAVVDIKGLF